MPTPTAGSRVRAFDVAAIAAVAVLLLIVGTRIDRLTGKAVSGAGRVDAPVLFPPPAPPSDVRDSFSRPDRPTLGTAATGQPWVQVAGEWGIHDSSATLLAAKGSGVSMAVVDLGDTDGTVTVTAAAVKTLDGLVVRARGPMDYWAVIDNPYSLRWTVVHLVGGTVVSPIALGTRRARAGDVLSVEMKGARIAVSVNGGSVVEVTDPTAPSGTRVGFVASSAGQRGRWRDLVATVSPAGVTTTKPAVSGSAP